MKISALKPLEKNPFKLKGDAELDGIAKSIQSFEKMMSIRKIVIDEDNQILGGNKRYYALKQLGYKTIPDEWIDKRTDLTEAEKREFIVKDNAHHGSVWDFEMLEDWNVPLYDWGVLAKEDNEEQVPAPTTEELIPFNQTHILISFPPEKLIDIQAIIEKLKTIESVEIEIGSN